MNAALKGSTPILAALALAFGLLFAWQLGGSEFRAVERQAAALRPLAAACGLDLPRVMALRLVLGSAQPAAEFELRCREFATAAARLGDALAAVAITGDRAAVQRAEAEAGGDAAAAWAALQLQPAGLPGLRFLAARQRFAARAAARD